MTKTIVLQFELDDYMSEFTNICNGLEGHALSNHPGYVVRRVLHFQIAGRKSLDFERETDYVAFVLVEAKPFDELELDQ
jgi:hypothetical protein